ncbi:MAG: ribulose-phosphate 3-epimerase [Candidatus Nealsonbacteria bacterium]
MKIRIIPSVIAKSQQEMEDKINLVKDYVKLIHLDIMDGVFVQNTSLNFDFRLPKTACEFEAHLMVQDPDNWVRENWEKADTIIIPAKSCKNPEGMISFLKGKRKIGFALNPETPLEKVKDYLDQSDEVLILTVKPGFYGSKFIPEVLEKVKELRHLKPELNIEVDGGISPATIKEAREAGANFFVSGSYIMNSGNPKEAIKTLKNLCPVRNKSRGR